MPAPTHSVPSRAPRRRRTLSAPLGAAALLIAAAVLAGCAGGGGAGAERTWVPQPPYTLEPNPVRPGAEQPVPSGQPTPSTTPLPSNPSRSGQSPSAATDPAIVAKHLAAPIGIAVLPDSTALVGQRRSGAIVRVQPLPNQPVTRVRTITGLDATGDGGLLDLALSPTYGQDHLIYAYITTATDNRVVAFTLTGPVTPVFTGIPKGATGNAGRLAFGADGNLYIGTGDAANPLLAQNPASLAGKVLQVTDVGQPVNPAGPVFAQGLHNLAGLCADPQTSALFETEAGGTGGLPASGDEINLLARGGDYGWPTQQPTSASAAKSLPAQANHTPSVAAGCAVSDSVLYVASLDGTSLYGANLIRSSQTSTVKLQAFTAPALAGKYGRLITVVAAPDGSLWLATSNTNTVPAAKGSKAGDDERILHIQPTGGGASSQA